MKNPNGIANLGGQLYAAQSKPSLSQLTECFDYRSLRFFTDIRHSFIQHENRRKFWHFSVTSIAERLGSSDDERLPITGDFYFPVAH